MLSYKSASITKKVFFFLVVSLLLIHPVHAELAIYQSNPLGLIYRERIKLEHRYNDNNSVSLAGAIYWYESKAEQFHIEYRHYKKNYFSDREFFYYVKVGGGNQEPGLDQKIDQAFNYSLLGAGIGWQFNLGERFFIDLSLGAKGFQTDRKSYTVMPVFSTVGPGSIIDLNVHIGFRFFKRSIYLYKRTARIYHFLSFLRLRCKFF